MDASAFNKHDIANLNQSPSGNYFYMKFKNEAIGSNLSFEKHFNPDLTVDSTYFKKFESVLNCV